MNSAKYVVPLVFLLALIVCLVQGRSKTHEASFEISNTGAEIVELQASLPDRDATIHLGQSGIRTFPAGTSVGMGDSKIRVNDGRIEVAHSGDNVVTLNYVNALGKNKTMMLGNGGTGFFHNTTRSISIGTATIQLVTKP